MFQKQEKTAQCTAFAYEISWKKKSSTQVSPLLPKESGTSKAAFSENKGKIKIFLRKV